MIRKGTAPQSFDDAAVTRQVVIGNPATTHLPSVRKGAWAENGYPSMMTPSRMKQLIVVMLLLAVSSESRAACLPLGSSTRFTPSCSGTLHMGMNDNFTGINHNTNHAALSVVVSPGGTYAVPPLYFATPGPHVSIGQSYTVSATGQWEHTIGAYDYYDRLDADGRYYGRYYSDHYSYASWATTPATANVHELACPEAVPYSLVGRIECDAGSSCSFNGQTVSSGSSVTAYLAKDSTTQCVSQSRTCTNGALSGGYQFESCTMLTPELTPATATMIVAFALLISWRVRRTSGPAS